MREWITYTCICFLMASNAWPCVKELSAAPYLKPGAPEYRRGVQELGNTSSGFLPPLSLTLLLFFVFFLLPPPPPPPPPPSLPFTVWVRISKVVFQRCIVAGYYRSNTTQGTPALWVLEQLRAEEQMSPSPPLSPPTPVACVSIRASRCSFGHPAPHKHTYWTRLF